MAKKKTYNKLNFAKAALRRASIYWVPISECRRLARVAPNQYKCAMCEGLFKSKETNVDHRIPVVDIENGTGTIQEYMDRLFVEVDELDLLCKNCHKSKSSVESSLRKTARQKKKVKNET